VVVKDVRGVGVAFCALCFVLFEYFFFVVHNKPLFVGAQISGLSDVVPIALSLDVLHEMNNAIKMVCVLTELIHDLDLLIVLDFIVYRHIYLLLFTISVPHLFHSVPVDLKAEDFRNLINFHLIFVGCLFFTTSTLSFNFFVHLNSKAFLKTLVQCFQ
jgi:hypothetical protein